MKKTILILAAIFIATQLFSQDVEKITITYNVAKNYSAEDLISVKQLLKLKSDFTSDDTEKVTRIYDIKNMKSYFKSNIQKDIVRDIVKFEKLENGTFHIVVDERNILFPKEDNIRIYTHQYVNPGKKLSVYNFQWKHIPMSAAIKAVNPKITLN